MAIPDYQTCMLPLLKLAGDKHEHALKDATRRLAAQFQLSDAEVAEYLPSGQQTVFSNRIGWARTYLKKAGLLASPRRGTLQITERGLAVLQEGPPKVDVKYLERYPEFIEFKSARRDAEATDGAKADAGEPTDQTPHEALEQAHERLRAELAVEIRQTLKSVDPAVFERIVVELLVKMGYGGNRQDAGRAIGRSGDEGIDGVIKEDHLGLDNVFVQAKRWEATIGRPEIQKFAGALQGQRARKGIFITTSDFSKEAEDFVAKIDAKIVLIDGKKLCDHLIDFGVGVTTVASYDVKKIDVDYFTDAG